MGKVFQELEHPLLMDADANAQFKKRLSRAAAGDPHASRQDFVWAKRPCMSRVEMNHSSPNEEPDR